MAVQSARQRVALRSQVQIPGLSASRLLGTSRPRTPTLNLTDLTASSQSRALRSSSSSGLGSGRWRMAMGAIRVPSHCLGVPLPANAYPPGTGEFSFGQHRCGSREGSHPSRRRESTLRKGCSSPGWEMEGWPAARSSSLRVSRGKTRETIWVSVAPLLGSLLPANCVPFGYVRVLLRRTSQAITLGFSDSSTKRKAPYHEGALRFGWEMEDGN